MLDDCTPTAAEVAEAKRIIALSEKTAAEKKAAKEQKLALKRQLAMSEVARLIEQIRQNMKALEKLQQENDHGLLICLEDVYRKVMAVDTETDWYSSSLHC